VEAFKAAGETVGVLGSFLLVGYSFLQFARRKGWLDRLGSGEEAQHISPVALPEGKESNGKKNAKSKGGKSKLGPVVSGRRQRATRVATDEEYGDGSSASDGDGEGDDGDDGYPRGNGRAMLD